METKRTGVSWMSLVFIGLLLAGWKLVSAAYNTFRASFEASLATAQVNDSIIEYSLIQKVINSDIVLWSIHGAFGLLVVLLVVRLVKSYLKQNS